MPHSSNLTFYCKIKLYLLLISISLFIGIIIILNSIPKIKISCIIEKDDKDHHYQFIPECACKRKYTFPRMENQTRILSTCSDDATWWERFQNVVTFSYYNPENSFSTKTFYSTGLRINAALVKKFYPGYYLRVYTNATLEIGDSFCEILCGNPSVHWCDIRKVPVRDGSFIDLSRMYPMTWRFLTMGDSAVNVFLSRDLDSVISEREVAAVKEWLREMKLSVRGIQLMRDHMSHNYPFLGGLWGASNKVIGRKVGKRLQRLIVYWSKHTSLTKNKGFDQSVLNSVIFYKKGNLIVAYDSYHCLRWRTVTQVKPFPVRRKNEKSDFCGNPDFGRGVYQLERCPVECRPVYGKDWEFC